mmetsp:Transcript_125225/g.234212  ORF Transcript_125225/g.234212 Transcript_125225/m.234212 type:complete len:231 (-) Transcript_125225:54-746(-)
MHEMMIALLCMACAGQGRPVKSSAEVADIGFESKSNPSRTLTLALLAHDSVAAFRPPGSPVSGGRRFPGAVGRGLAQIPRHAARTQLAGIRCQEAPAENAPAAKESKQEMLKPIEDPEDTVVELVAEASDPFRLIRGVIYVTFGVTGLAGIVISALQMGKNPASSIANLGINAAVLAAGIAVFLFDRQTTAKFRENAKQELENPFLKGDGVMESEEEEKEKSEEQKEEKK